jgi:hypothetical protein
MNTYEKGKAEGRAESEKMLFNWKLRYESVKKQAYEKGVAGYEQGQSDLKARLIKMIKTNCKGWWENDKTN